MCIRDRPQEEQSELFYAKNENAYVHNPWPDILENVRSALQERDRKRGMGRGYQAQSISPRRQEYELQSSRGFNPQQNLGGSGTTTRTSNRARLPDAVVLRRVDANFDIPPNIYDNNLSLYVVWGSVERVFPWNGRGTLNNPIWEFSEEDGYFVNQNNSINMDVYIYNGQDVNNLDSLLGQTVIPVDQAIEGLTSNSALFKNCLLYTSPSPRDS
eukprot:TRINITY_DN4111_c0_g1_i1.p1 TRINITY_DN4111_c0_g1~~TRINITY_DN4111_c0_g1_i1.p1  ORF type:complete len:214 (-),score=41.76 TRINITY_DN4111_c0_g1_i1:40-681(-)